MGELADLLMSMTEESDHWESQKKALRIAEKGNKRTNHVWRRLSCRPRRSERLVAAAMKMLTCAVAPILITVPCQLVKK